MTFETTTQLVAFAAKNPELSESVLKFDGILKDYIDGQSLKLCFENNGLSKGQFYGLIATYPILANFYARAQEARSEGFADEIVEIADTELDYNRARNKIDARKWVASKILPGKYGDRLELNVNGTLDLNAAVVEARSRTLPQRYPEEVIDAQAHDITNTTQQTTTDNESVAPSIFD